MYLHNTYPHRGQILHLKHFSVLAAAAKKLEQYTERLYQAQLLIAEQATKERIKVMGDELDADTYTLLQGKLNLEDGR